MRIASLVPSATEMAFALGLGPEVVAVTHECDHPPEVAKLARITASEIPEDLPPAEIDRRVGERVASGLSLYRLDTDRLAELEVDLILTQAVCAVCAVSYDDVRAVAGRLPNRPRVLSLDPRRLTEVFADAVAVAEAAGRREVGVELERELRARVEAVREATAAAPKPRVAAIEWLDPPYVAGHWLPEMIEAAGGVDPLANPGERSRTLEWEEIAAARPEAAVVMPCGLYCHNALRETERHRSELAALGVERAWAVDAASSFSRPGPRLADGVELLGHLLHPELVEAPASLEWAALELG
ncbi:MAG: ABC transporter substrate-binding protein [Solirubrobacterales bacterium]